MNYMTENEAAHFLELTHPFYGRKFSLKVEEDFTKYEITDQKVHGMNLICSYFKFIKKLASDHHIMRH